MTDLGCTCIYDPSGDYECAAIFEAKVITARKTKRPHVCCECNEVISPGEQYERISGLWEGEWSHFKTCMGCRAIRNDLCACGHIYGTLREVIREEMGFDYVTGKWCTQGWWKGKD